MGDFEDYARSIQGKLHWRTNPSSPPYCVFRNFSNYFYNQHQLNQTSFAIHNRHLKQTIRHVANEQTIFYSEHIGDHMIPSSLLHKVIEEDLTIQQRPDTSKRSTVLTVFHDDEFLLLHSGGSHMDEIIMRSPYFLDPYHTRNQPLSSINLGNGAAIRQIVKAGRTSHGRSANILARTNHEIYHLQTVNVSDFIEEPNPNTDPCAALPKLCTLEPISKWQLPEEMIDLAGSPSDWTYAFALSTNHRLYQWSPRTGFTKHSDIPIFQKFPNSTTDSPCSFEISLHPCIVYTSMKDQFCTYDCRTASGAQVLYSAAQNKTITCIKQHERISYLHMTSTENGLYLMDTRYPKAHVNKQTLTKGYDHMAFRRFTDVISNTNEHQALDVFLGGSKFCNQLHVHSMDSGGYNAHSNHLDPHQTFYHSIPQRINLGHLINAASPFSISTSVRWRSSSSPMIDSHQAAIGFDIVPFVPFQYVEQRRHSSVIDMTTGQGSRMEDSSEHATSHGGHGSSSSTANAAEAEESSSSNNDPLQRVYRSSCYESIGLDDPDYNALIVQQNAIGDVYVQRYLFSSHEDECIVSNTTRTKSSWESQDPHNEHEQPGQEKASTVVQQQSSQMQTPGKVSFSQRSNTFQTPLPKTPNSRAKRNKWASLIAGEEEDSEDEEDEEEDDGDDNMQTTPNRMKSAFKQAPSSSFKGISQLTQSSLDENLGNFFGGKSEGKILLPFAECEENSRLPPLQPHLPIGTRLHALPPPGYLSYAIHRWITANAYILQHIHPYRLPINVLVYQKQEAFRRYDAQVAPGLKMSTTQLVTAEDQEINAYPLTSQNYLLLIPEDGLMKTEIVRFFVRDLRRDLPLLHKAPDYQALKLPPPLITHAQEVRNILLPLRNALHDFVHQRYYGKCSLWEIWKYLLENHKVRISYPSLRIGLLESLQWLEHIPSTGLDILSTAEQHSYNSDGYYIRLRQTSNPRKSMEFGHEYGCQCMTSWPTVAVQLRKQVQVRKRILLLQQQQQQQLNRKTKKPVNRYSIFTQDEDEDEGDDDNDSEVDNRKQQQQQQQQQQQEELLATMQLVCDKKDCIVPHRLLYSAKPLKRLLEDTERIAKEQQEKEQLLGKTSSLQHTDVTKNICRMLDDRWDIDSAKAYVHWPVCETTSSKRAKSLNLFDQEEEMQNGNAQEQGEDGDGEYYRA